MYMCIASYVWVSLTFDYQLKKQSIKEQMDTVKKIEPEKNKIPKFKTKLPIII